MVYRHIHYSFSFGILFTKKKLPGEYDYIDCLFPATIARIADHLFAGPPLDLYDLMDSGNYDLFDILSYPLYGPVAYIFLYIYEKFEIKGGFINS